MNTYDTQLNSINNLLSIRQFLCEAFNLLFANFSLSIVVFMLILEGLRQIIPLKMGEGTGKRLKNEDCRFTSSLCVLVANSQNHTNSITRRDKNAIFKSTTAICIFTTRHCKRDMRRMKPTGWLAPRYLSQMKGSGRFGEHA